MGRARASGADAETRPQRGHRFGHGAVLLAAVPALRDVAETILEVFKDFQFVTGERGLKAIGKPDKELILLPCGCARDNTDRAARMDERVVRSPNFDQGHDLCPGENVVRLVRH